MTAATIAAIAAPQGALYDTVARLLDEATTGPVNSGLSETVSDGGVDIEMSASRDWGLLLTRALPTGAVSRHLTGEDLTMAAAAAAYAELRRL